MKDFEKQIEEEGTDFVENQMRFSFKSMDTLTMARRLLRSYETGAKSEAAKEYWFSIFEKDKSETEKHLNEFIKLKFDNESIYSEEEVKTLLQKYGKFVWSNNMDLSSWFEQNKKKS